MSSELMENDYVDTRLVSALLNSQQGPACIIKIQDELIGIRYANDDFLKLIGIDSIGPGGLLPADIYDPGVLSVLIADLLQAVQTKTHRESSVILCLQGLSSQTMRFGAKYSYLFGSEGVFYVLQLLIRPKAPSGLVNDHIPFADATRNAFAVKHLFENGKLFKAMVHDGSDIIAILDETANYLYVSPSSKSILDLEPNSFVGRNAFEFIHPQDIEKANLEFADAAGQKKVSLTPFRFRHNNGTWRWIQTIITDLRGTPSIGGFVANSRDVSDILQAQKALEVTNERYRYVSRATSDAIWDYDVASSTLLWGEGFKKMFGYSDDTLQSDIMSWHSRIHPADAQRVEAKLESFLASEETNWRDDYRFLKADGNYAHVVDKGFVIRDNQGRPQRMIGAMQDITLRKKEEARLRVLESVVTNTIDAVIIAQILPPGEQNIGIVFVNKAFERMTGYRSGEVEGRNPWFLQGSGSDHLELEKLLACIESSQPYQGTNINYKKNGDEIWVSYSVAPVADPQGIHTHWVAILRDVTENKNREIKQQLLSDINTIFNKEQGLRDTVVAMLSKVCEFGKFACAALFTNDDLSDSLELSACRFHNDAEAGSGLHRDDVFINKHYAQQIKNNGKPGHWKLGNTGEELFKKDIRGLCGIPLYRHETLIGVLLLGTTKTAPLDLSGLPEDLGSHLATELHRKKLEQDLEHIFKLAPDIIAITDFSGNFKKLNPAASELLGYSMETLLSKPFSDFLHPNEKQLNISELESLRQSGKNYYIEEQYLTLDGRSKWLAWTSHPIQREGLIYSVAKDITDKKELEQLLLNSNSLARIGSWEQTFPEKKVSWSIITREIMDADSGYLPTEDMPLGAFYPQEAMEMMQKRILAARNQGVPWDEVLQIKTNSGQLKWVRSIGSSEMVEGKCLRIFGSLQDIDQQMHAEFSARAARAELEESEKRYSELFHLSPLPMWVYDFETLDFVDVNQTAIASYGYSKKEFLSMNIRAIRPPEEIRKLEKAMIKTRKNEASIFRGTFNHTKKNGEIIQVDIKSNTIIYKGRKAKVIIATDITERLRQFQAIELRNKRLREVAWIQSHKVRAPLAKLMGLVQLLSSRMPQAPATEKILDYLNTSAQELDAVIREVVVKSEELAEPDL
ncbi:MAG: PAS domain S-box protein [Pedobacter sp.]|nr:MAG: PAS domain S-box protein [Pedobacter sp.]